MKYLLFALIFLSYFKSCFANETRPNIIVILSDDMGFSDLSCYGGIIDTPVLDALAQNGLKYTQFYNTARCCPSRASLLTGQHPHKAGVGWMTSDKKEPGYRGALNKNSITIAEMLSLNGYETYAVGKWHVSLNISSNHNFPKQRGFDHFYGTHTGAGNYFNPATLLRDNTFISPYNDPKYSVENYYYTDAIGDNAVLYLKERKSTGDAKPFFMYVAFTAAHWPMHAPESEIAAYKGKFDKGWDILRKEKFGNMQKMGLLHSSWKLSQDPDVEKWEDVKNKEFELRCMETYAAMVTSMDKNIGKIINYLKETNQLENTVIFYLQDNGACAELHGRKFDEPTALPIPKGKKLEPMPKDEIQLDRNYYRTRDGKPIYTGIGVMAGAENTDVGYGKGWAHYSNVPFREYKHFIHEGGIATPLIIHWPRGIKKTGQMRNQPGQLPDIMATIADVTKSSYPKEYNGNEVYALAGKSLAESFDNDNPFYERPLFWEHEGNRGVRMGKWKLVYRVKKNADATVFEWKDIPKENWSLYDLENDRTEQNDLAHQNPKIVDKLFNAWIKFAEENFVKPWPKK